MEKNAQGALEYLLLIGGAVLVAGTVLVMVLGVGGASGGQARSGAIAANDLIEQKQAESGMANSGVITNGFFELPRGWGESTNCASGTCYLRSNAAGQSIPGKGYGWYMKTSNPGNWGIVSMKQQIPGLNAPNKAFNLEFRYWCITASSGGGWHMRFRTLAPSFNDVYSNAGTAIKDDGSTSSKSMTSFTCIANESGKFTAPLQTNGLAGTDYFWYVWPYAGNGVQEMVIDNLKAMPA